MIQFVQVNLKKAFIAAVELNKTLSAIGEFIALITEPYAFNGKIRSAPPRCTKIAFDEKPRAAILASNNINIITIQKLTSRDCAVGLLQTEEKKS